MKVALKIFSESVGQAVQQLVGNKLRSFLSLLGISIGIFCIIGVQSAVDSLEDNVRSSFDKLGDDVVYVQKFSWGEDPGQNFFKFMRRPNVDYDDFDAVDTKVRSADLVAYYVFLGRKTAKFRSSSADRVFMLAGTYDFGDLFKVSIDQGRYFSPSEYHYGSQVCIIGAQVAEAIFGSLNPIGRQIKIDGRKLEVIGVFEKSGESLVRVLDFDEAVFISYELGRKFANMRATNAFGNTTLAIKASEGIDIRQMKDEVKIALRAERRLKPKEDDNFSLNELSIITEALTGFFQVLNMVGLVIGIFSIFVGAFSVANIMFVSVKERTNLIGIKKAIGAKKYMILLEFLVESIILCIVGGLIGLFLVFLVVYFLSQAIDFPMYMSTKNILIGFAWSIGIGILAGLIPAAQAANMDPVEAMRQ